jgi:hypothetical protein
MWESGIFVITLSDWTQGLKENTLRNIGIKVRPQIGHLKVHDIYNTNKSDTVNHLSLIILIIHGPKITQL